MVEILEKLLMTPTPTGYEKYNAIPLFESFEQNFMQMKQNTAPLSLHTDAVGNVELRYGDLSTATKKVLLSAHIDTICLQVQYVDDNGFIHFISNGGIDPFTLCGTEVQILTRKSGYKNVVNGVIARKSKFHDKKNTTPEVELLKVDIGTNSKEETLELISIGDPIMYRNNSGKLGPYRYYSPGLDDKTGLAVVIKTLETIIKNNIVYDKLYLQFAGITQEETTGSGAVSLASHMDTDFKCYSIDYDVCFATDDGYASKDKWGDVKLGEGGCIVHGCDQNPDFVNMVIDLCDKHGVPYQEFALGKGGMTNTQTIKQASGNQNIETLLLQIPLRNMHSNVEVCDVRDLDSLVNMTMVILEQLNK